MESGKLVGISGAAFLVWAPPGSIFGPSGSSMGDSALNFRVFDEKNIRFEAKNLFSNFLRALAGGLV